MGSSPFYNKAQVKDRGWTDTAITKFLGQPDRRGKNSRGRRGKVSLYFKDRVHEVESTTAFRQWKAKSAARRTSALAAAEKKRAATLQKVASRLDSVQLRNDIQNLSRQKLREKASASFLELEQRREQRSGGRYTAEKITSRRGEKFFARIEVNYLRHEGTLYDDELKEYFNATGVGQAVDMVRERVYGLIADAYPHLKDECERQLQLRRAKELRKRGQDVSSRSARLDR